MTNYKNVIFSRKHARVYRPIQDVKYWKDGDE